ncbi:MAG: ABC transporter ATP-binding protein [Spirochaetales bacterium]|nr:ABC transporter ATP-binding protein [Spirochaetales bacterium]
MQFEDVGVLYQGIPAVQNLSFALQEGEVSVLVGPSGCGKSTTLRLVNRLLNPTTGKIFYQDQPLSQYEPETLRRSMGYSIQGVGLFPHWTVAQNVAAVPQLLKWPAARTQSRIDEVLDLVGLEPSRFRKKFPAELSGGEAQRVGIARALAGDPPLLLMDEPFGAVDALQRNRLQKVLLSIQKHVKKTILLVTHDLDEAVLLSDRLLVLQQGRLVQHASPSEVLRSPATPFVQEFLGADRALKRLIRYRAQDVMEPLGAGVEVGSLDQVQHNTNLRDAFSLMVALGKDSLYVVDGSQVLGQLYKKAIEKLAAEDQS